MHTSIIIRTKNEERWIGAVLERLAEQTDQDFEIVIVDSGSTDRTLEIVSKFQVNLVQIPPELFSYPYALNVGCRAAQADKYFIFLSAHSFPLSRTWLADGLRNFANEKVFGIYGMMQALPDGTVWEKLVFPAWKVALARLIGRRTIISAPGLGVMGFTHAAIRRSCWEQLPFDESYGLGGEDEVWAAEWFRRGYVAVKDAKFSVAHSHGLGLSALIKQFQYWKSLRVPQPYRALEFRKHK